MSILILKDEEILDVTGGLDAVVADAGTLGGSAIVLSNGKGPGFDIGLPNGRFLDLPGHDPEGFIREPGFKGYQF